MYFFLKPPIFTVNSRAFRSRAIHWDGRNVFGEKVVTGTLTPAYRCAILTKQILKEENEQSKQSEFMNHPSTKLQKWSTIHGYQTSFRQQNLKL